MHIVLYSDDSVPVDLAKLAKNISARSEGIKCTAGRSTFSVPTDRVMYPQTYSLLPKKFYYANRKADLTICFTKVPYDNNYFFEYKGDTAIVSFYGWEKLTSLPMNNGVLYFVLMILSRMLPLGPSHRRTTGCINDFNGDKRTIDVGMRSAFLCPGCIGAIDTSSPFTGRDKKIFKTLKHLLNDLSSASRANTDIAKYWGSLGPAATFDVFICHNSADKKSVRQLTKQLKHLGLQPWLDEEQLRPGLPWQSELEKVITKIGAAAVIVGPSRIGPWQDAELRAFLAEFVKRGSPVIPVLLPGLKSPPNLPVFLNQMTWVDMRSKPKRALTSLVWGITGRNPQVLRTRRRARKTRRKA
jgi:hypothetical protein